SLSLWLNLSLSYPISSLLLLSPFLLSLFSLSLAHTHTRTHTHTHTRSHSFFHSFCLSVSPFLSFCHILCQGHAHTPVCMQVHICTDLHTPTPIHIHTHSHTHTHTVSHSH